MSTSIKLSILDQSIVRRNMTAKDALENTIEVAKLADELGYHRFWVSEHHNSSAIAGTAPEILMMRLASDTKHIRIGSGGVMLPNHSELKVAENFRILETLFPGRIDLGMGRAPGTDRLTSALLNPSNNFSEQEYLQQLENLQLYFTDSASTKYGSVIAAPVTETIPAQWILSSSGGSSKIAAKYGMGLSVAKFINGDVTPLAVELYMNNFQPSEQLQKPKTFLSITVLCAETEEEANALRFQTDYALLNFAKGNFGEFWDYQDIKNYEFTTSDRQIIHQNSNRIVSGTPDRVKEKLEQLAKDFYTDEIMITTMNTSPKDRIQIFKLLAKEFNLKSQQLS
ncbi:LLM class flavin-dependent oxidoreductase [Zhouia sp. PK063]|uniref:LLM class flavin-dependent oxidoreductase n=1 Tax=Zhouia sp. PK063 TaxID=3373602 RepID=UPI0037AA2536